MPAKPWRTKRSGLLLEQDDFLERLRTKAAKAKGTWFCTPTVGLIRYRSSAGCPARCPIEFLASCKAGGVRRAAKKLNLSSDLYDRVISAADNHATFYFRNNDRDFVGNLRHRIMEIVGLVEPANKEISKAA